MTHVDTPTCGKGLAANARLPAALAELMAARAEVLERHTNALDPNDPDARRERDVYLRLARHHREIARALGALADEMAGARDLAMAPHDAAVMRDPAGQSEAYARFVERGREVAELLRER